MVANQGLGVLEFMIGEFDEQTLDLSAPGQAELLLRFIQPVEDLIDVGARHSIRQRKSVNPIYKCFRKNVAIFQASMAFQGIDAKV